MTEVTRQLQDYFEKRGENAIGALAYWTLSGVEVQRDAFREAMEAIGLGGAVARDPRPEALLSKAVDKVKPGLQGMYFRRLGRYEHALLVEHKDEEGRLHGSHVYTLRAAEPAGGGAWEAQAVGVVEQALPMAAAVAQKVCDAYRHARDYIDTADLSSTIVRALHGSYRDPMLAAVSLRETTGGLYFVPSQGLDKLRALAAYVRQQGGCTFAAFTLYADAENLEQAGQAAQRDFRTQLAETQKEVQGFLDGLRAKKGEATDRNLEVRLRRYDALRDRVDLWADVLGDARQGLLDTIAEAKTAMAAEMGL